MAEQPPTGPPLQEPSDSETSTAPATTPGGYAYTVVHDEPAKVASPRSGGAGSPWPWVALALVPLLLIAVGAYLFLDGTFGGGGEERLHADVTNIVNAFSQAGGESASERYEGALPPGLPEGVPAYPGARVLSSIRQTTGADASYLVVYDTEDAHSDVLGYFDEALDEDPWQLEGGQDSRDSTVHSFSRIDDADVSGIVLTVEATGDDLTTIVLSVDVVSGADDPEMSFVLEPSRALPEGFPEAIPQYPGAAVVESAYSKQGGATSFLVSYVTDADARDVLAYFSDEMEAAGLTVQEGDASDSDLAGADALNFSDADSTIVGDVFVGDFPQDASYTQIDVRVRQEE